MPDDEKEKSSRPEQSSSHKAKKQDRSSSEAPDVEDKQAPAKAGSEQEASTEEPPASRPEVELTNARMERLRNKLKSKYH